MFSHAKRPYESADYENRKKSAKDILQNTGMEFVPDYLPDEIARDPNHIYEFCRQYFCNDFFAGCTYDDIQFFTEQLLVNTQNISVSVSYAVKICPAVDPTAFYRKFSESITESTIEDTLNSMTDPRKKIAFLKVYGRLNTRRGFVVAVVSSLPEELRSEAALILDHKIYDGDELSQIARLFPDSKIDFLVSFVTRVRSRFTSNINKLLVDANISDTAEFSAKIATSIKTTNQLRIYLTWNEDKDRLNLARQFSSTINDADGIINICYELNHTDRLQFCIEQKGKISNQQSLLKILRILSDDNQLIFMKQYKADFIRDENDLIAILAVLDISHRFDVACAHISVVKSMAGAKNILPHLLADKKGKFLRAYIESIRRDQQAGNSTYLICKLFFELLANDNSNNQLVTKAIDILLSSQAYPVDEIISYGNSFRSSYSSYKVAQEILQNHRIHDFSRDIINRKLPYFCYLVDLKVIKIEDMPNEAHTMERVHRVNLENILESPVKFGKNALKTILDCGFTVARLIDCIHPWTLHRLLEHATRFSVLINSVADAATKANIINEILQCTQEAFLSTLDILENRDKYIREHSNARSDTQLAGVLQHILNPFRLDMARACKSVITTASQLALVLVELPESCRYAFVKELSHLIKIGSDVISIVKRLPDNAKLAFMREHQSLINDPDIIIVMMSALNKNSVEDIKAFLTEFVHDEKQFVTILKMLPENMRLEIAIEFKSLFDSIEKMVPVVEAIPAQNRRSFLLNSVISESDMQAKAENSHLLNFLLTNSLTKADAPRSVIATTMELLLGSLASVPIKDQIDLINLLNIKAETNNTLPAFLSGPQVLPHIKQVIREQLLTTYFLLDHKIISPVDLISAKVNDTHTNIVNLENLLKSPAKFKPDSLKTLLSCGFTLNQLISCQHTWTLHHMLDQADKVKMLITETLAAPGNKISRIQLLGELTNMDADTVLKKLAPARHWGFLSWLGGGKSYPSEAASSPTLTSMMHN